MHIPKMIFVRTKKRLDNVIDRVLCVLDSARKKKDLDLCMSMKEILIELHAIEDYLDLVEEDIRSS